MGGVDGVGHRHKKCLRQRAESKRPRFTTGPFLFHLQMLRPRRCVATIRDAAPSYRPQRPLLQQAHLPSPFR